MIGSALMAYTYRNFSAFQFGSQNLPVGILPIDIEGRFFGLLQLKRGDGENQFQNGERFDTIDKTTTGPFNADLPGARVVFELRKNSVVIFRSQVWGKKQWRPTQRFSSGGQWAVGLNSWDFLPQPPVNPPYAFNVSAVGYGNAYFMPSTWPSAAPSTTPAEHYKPLAVHPEPFAITFDRKLGDVIEWTVRAYSDRPNAALGANALNDDAPPADLTVRPAEVELLYTPFAPNELAYRLDGFIVRIGNTDAEQITTIPNDPNWGTSGT